MHRKRIVGSLLGALVALSSATAVAASEPTSVGLYGCSLAGGTREVEAGSPVILTSGWGATNRGLVEAFVRGGGSFSLSIDGEAVDLGDSMNPIERQADGLWFVTFGYPAGTLESGESLDAHLEIVLDHVFYDGFERFQPGTTEIDCLIIAT